MNNKWWVISVIALALFGAAMVFVTADSRVLLKAEKARVKELEQQVNELKLQAGKHHTDSKESEAKAETIIEKIKYIRQDETKIVDSVTRLSDDSLVVELQRSLADIDSHRRPDGLLVRPQSGQ